MPATCFGEFRRRIEGKRSTSTVAAGIDGKGKGDRRPSLLLKDGDKQLLVTCFAGCDRRDVLDELRRRGLLERGNANPLIAPGCTPSHRAFEEREPDPDPEALELWQQGDQLDGTLGERYLHDHRGLVAPYAPSIRFLPGARYPHSGIALPALVAAVSRPDRKIVAVQLTFLRPSDGAKAKLNAPRITVGRLGTGAVRLASAGDMLGLAEGLETALSAQQLSGIPCWATLGGQRLSKITAPDAVKEQGHCHSLRCHHHSAPSDSMSGRAPDWPPTWPTGPNHARAKIDLAQ